MLRFMSLWISCWQKKAFIYQRVNCRVNGTAASRRSVDCCHLRRPGAALGVVVEPGQKLCVKGLDRADDAGREEKI